MEITGPTLKSVISQATKGYKKPTAKSPKKVSSGYQQTRYETPPAIPQQSRLEQIRGATGDFRRNYESMREANWIGADKYFHCLANCQATRRGPHGEATARNMSNAREWSQWVDNNLGGSDGAEDRHANRTGRNGARNNPGAASHTICREFMPAGLPSRYWGD